MVQDSLDEHSPRLVLGHPLFHGMPDAVARILLRDCASLHAQNGDVLFQEGAEALEYVYVFEGEVEVLRCAQDGPPRVFHIFHAGQLLAETAMFMTHGRYPMNARARGDAVVLCLKRAGLHRACQAWPELAIRLLNRLSDRVYQRINEVEWFSESTAAQRLADYLLRQPVDAEGAVHLSITQRQLAARLGVRPETLSRMLAEWVDQHRLQGARRRWVVRDRAFLEELARPAQRSF